MAPDLVARAERTLTRRAPNPSTVARVGLGAVVFLAGVHKLVDPLAWTAYVVDWLVPWLVVTPREFMLANGVLEVGFGAAIAVDRYTVPAAAVAAVSLTATVAYLLVVAATEGGLFLDVTVRDVGLAALAWAVLFDAVRD
jgi:uncharacterized membrane protein YphA (DoxX/SURF4 family)